MFNYDHVLINQCLEMFSELQASPLPADCASFSYFWTNFAIENVVELELEHKDINHAHMLLSPTYAADLVRNHATAERCFWVGVSRHIWCLYSDYLDLLLDARLNAYADIIPVSVFEGFLTVWRAAIVEVLIERRGCERIRSASQAEVYALSRSAKHRGMSRNFNRRRNEESIFKLAS